ncbi:protein sax-3-like isoform X2 [Argiope bruennichi]|uniref:protein sax-3-like isoform X2 n=1 Tax=Argiope bruennichi TaxID=94029 RepID=UPI0024945BF3|nr:protein sax-3-like isoform X2 [Argiope bruennichi]
MIFILLWMCVETLLVVGGQRPPRITEHPSDVLVRKHEPATLNCKAEGRPEPTIEWYHEGSKVKNTANRMVLPSGSLFFLHVIHTKREQDTGTYWCLASNEVGKARSRNATLEVAVLREEFRLSPKPVQAAMGESTVLECVPPKGHPEPTVRWRKDGEYVNTNKGRFRIVSPGNLVINDVRQSDEGHYRCVAENMAGIRESTPAIMTVHVKPFFVREPDHVTVLADEDVQFECKVGGDPLPTITWRRQDGKMPVGRAQIQEDKSLLIKDVLPSDEGMYICEAENPVGIISASVTLTVHSRPIFLKTPRDQRVGLNGIAKFECSATGNPPPSVFWTKEGNQVLMFPERSFGRFSVTREGMLIISGVMKEDKGYYTCSVVSGVGSTMAKAYLEVTAVGDLPPPIILLGPANQTLPLSTEVMLPCEASGTPTPSIRWLFNSGPIPSNPRYKVLDSGTLKIDALQSTDSGIYTCTASSESGETSWSASLSVESPRNPNVIFHRAPDPSTFPKPPGQPTALNVTETSVTLQWQRSTNMGASPLIGYRVEYYSSDLQSGWVVTAHHVATESHVVHNLRPDTHYQFLVRAENSHGLSLPSPSSKVIKTLGLPAHMLPDYDLEEARIQLSNIAVELQDIRPISSTAVKLFWKIQGAEEHVEGFYIRFRDLNSGSQKYNMVTVLNGGASSYVLTDLRKFTKYEFFLVPFYKSVEGPPSNSQSAQTLEDVPSAPPDNLHVEILSKTSAAIYWSSPPPQHINGGLKGYLVQVYDNSSNLHSNVTTNSTTTHITLKNLTAGVLYKTKAEAFTQAGVGPSTNFVNILIDPHLIGGVDSGLSRRSSSLHTIVQQPWFIAVLGSFLFLVLSVFLVAVFFRRRLAWKKALGVQINVPLHKTEGIRGVNSCETLWINQTLNSSHASNPNSLNDSKLLEKPDSSMEHNYYSVCAPDYAEVDTHNMATYYKRDISCVLAPYATTTLINTPKPTGGSVYDSKSSSSELSKKSDKPMDQVRLPDDVFEQFLNKGQPCSSVNYSNDYGYQSRQIKNKFMPATSKVNWTDVIPPPPENPPTELTTSPGRPMNVRNLSPVKCPYQAQSYQGNFTNKPIGNTSPWSTLGRNIDNDGAAIGLFGLKGPQGLLPQRTLPQGTAGERVFQGSLTSLRSDQFPGLNRRISQNGMIPGFPFPFFMKSSTSGGDVHQIYAGTVLQDPSNPPQDGEDIELNNLYSHRTSITDQTSGFIANNPTPEENHNVRVCGNEYSNNFFIAEYNAGRAQTTLRNRSSRPPSSYSNDGNSSGTVPSRNCQAKQKWKDSDTGEKQQNDDIPSYQKPAFPSCTSSTSQGSSRRRREGKGVVNELSSLTQFASLSEKYGESASTETTDKGDNNEQSEEKR